MWGPGFAALICYNIFRRKHIRTISFLGSSAIQSFAFYFFPFIVYLVTGLVTHTHNHAQYDSEWRLTPFIYAELGLLNIVGQELGWRGFLQDAIRPLPKFSRYILIGILWEFWHLTSRTALGNMTDIATRIIIYYPLCILFSWIVGEATDKSKSLFVAITLHFWVYMLYDLRDMQTIITILISMPVWLYLLYNWKQKYDSVVVIRRGNNSIFEPDEGN